MMIYGRFLVVWIVLCSIKGVSCAESALQDWIRARCGPSGNALWAFEGALYDPLNGNKIANVEGLELVRSLAETDGKEDSKQRYKRRCGDLKAPETVALNSSNLDYAATLLSRKLFCYTTVEKKPKLLQSIRLRPNSPIRKIPPEQAAAVFDTATTYIQRGKQLLVHTEWPDGRALFSKTNIALSEEPEEDWRINTNQGRREIIEFTTYARPQPKGRSLELDLSKPFRQESSVSPKRAAILQLGASSADAIRFGARETYQYTASRFGNDATCRVRYTRYGEGPTWYGPGRFCTLELTGKRVKDANDLPPIAARVAAEKVLGFLSVNAPVAQDDSLAARAVEWFRGKGNVPIIAPDADGALSWQNDLIDRGTFFLNRLRAATSWNVGSR